MRTIVTHVPLDTFFANTAQMKDKQTNITQPKKEKKKEKNKKSIATLSTSNFNIK